MWYYVIVVYKGSPSIEGRYKTRDAAEKRADSIVGGTIHVFKSQSSDLSTALREFRDEEVAAL